MSARVWRSGTSLALQGVSERRGRSIRFVSRSTAASVNSHAAAIVTLVRFRCLSEKAELYCLSGSGSPGLPFSGFPVFQTPACYPQNLFSTGNSSRRLSSSPGPLPFHSPPPQMPRDQKARTLHQGIPWGHRVVRLARSRTTQRQPS
jgi:hypothetical protein